MAKPTLRLATIHDLEQLIELRVLMQKEVNNPEQVSPGYREALRGYFVESLSNQTYVSAVAELDGKLVAANGMVIYTKPPSVNGGTGRMGYISNVYTRFEWRGQGIASDLMKLLIDYGRSNGLDKLHLGATDQGMGVYERVGFKTPRFPQFELRLS